MGRPSVARRRPILSRQSRTRATVLMVEDNAGVLELGATVLEEAG